MSFSKLDSRLINAPHTASAASFYSLNHRRKLSILKNESVTPTITDSKSYFKAVTDLYMQTGCLKCPISDQSKDLYEDDETRFNNNRSKQKSKIINSRPGTFGNKNYVVIKLNEEDNQKPLKDVFTNPLFLKNAKAARGLDTKSIELLRKGTTRWPESPKASDITLPDQKEFAFGNFERSRIQKMARKLLVCSKVQAQKSEKNKGILKKGSGMLMSSGNLLKTNNQVYKDLLMSISKRNKK